MAEVAPESKQGSFRLLGFDGQGGLQLIGGLVIGLIALYSSYDHVNILSSTIHLNQQWGVWLIVASLAVVVIDAQLASRSRLGEENRRIQDERTATEARKRQAKQTERQGQGIALLRSAALLSARVQLDPSELNRSRLNAFLALLAEEALNDKQ
jgi:hypothetical protein